MAKSVMGGQSSTQVKEAWRLACQEVEAERKASGFNLSGKDKPLPASNAGLVGKWRAAGAAVEKQMSPKKRQREVLNDLLRSGDDEQRAAAEAMLEGLGDGE